MQLFAVVLSLQAWANIGETLVQSQVLYDLAQDHLWDSTCLLERVSLLFLGLKQNQLQNSLPQQML